MSYIKIINLKIYSNDKRKKKTTRSHHIFEKLNIKKLFYVFDWNGCQKIRISKQKPQTKFGAVQNYLKVALFENRSTCYYQC